MQQRHVEHTKTIKLFLGISLSAVLMGVILGVYWFNQILSDISRVDQQHTQQLLNLNKSLNDAGLELGMEIQEWKDTLLRIHDAALFAKHQNAFHAEHFLVQRELRRTQQTALELGIPGQEFESLIAEHQQLLQHYDAALRFYNPKKQLSFRVVDTQVRGIDRTLQKNLRDARNLIDVQVEQHVESLSIVGEDKTRQHRFVLLGVTGVLLPLISFMGFYFSHRSLKRISNDNERARIVFEAIGDAVIVTDAMGNIEHINLIAQSIVGRSSAEACGRPLVEIFPIYNELSGEAVANPVETVLRERRTLGLSNHTVLRTHDGRLVPIEDSAAPVKDKQGNVCGVVLVFHDISERIAAQRALVQDRRQIEAQLQQRLFLTQALANLSDTVSHAEQIDQIYDEALDTLQQTIGCDRGAILLFDPDGVIRFKATRGISEAYIKRFTGHTPWTANEKNAQPILVPDEEEWEDGKTLIPEFRKEGIRALGFIPLDYKGQLLGKFMVYFNEPHSFSTEDVHIMQTIARHVGYAIGQKRSDVALYESEQRWRFALEGSGDGMWEWNIQTGEINISKTGKAMFGFAKDEIGNSMNEWQARIHPEDKAHWMETTRAYFKGQDAIFTCEYRLLCRNDTWKWILVRGMAIDRSADGRVLRMLGTQTDMDERKQIEKRLQLTSSVFSHAKEGIMITDAAGTLLEVNDEFTQITGYSREEVLGRNPRMLHSGKQTPEVYGSMWHALTTEGHWSGELWNKRKNGELYAEVINISAVGDIHGKTQNYVAVFSDITQLKEYQNQLEHIAHYDALTNLPNRMLLADRLHQAMALSQRRDTFLAVAYLDLDGFKAINDIYGHGTGDELLIALAQRMKNALREGDTLARIGGDEFVAVLLDLDHAQTWEAVLDRLLLAASDPLMVGNAMLQVSASIGVTLYPQDEGDADLLMRHADQAMYQAKRAGKNRYHVFDVIEDAAVQTFLESTEKIRNAFTRREFVLFYQPKVNMRTGEVIGAEALIRWQHPELGLLPPAHFLPIVENKPISVELGEWVIETVLTQIGEWNAGGLDIPVSVNVGAYQLESDNFVTRLAAMLAAHPEIQSGSLELEILETSALDDFVKVSEIMRGCNMLGVHFALDDFGTGYSSLTYLKRLPSEFLKVDQSFVRDMLEDPDDLAIVKGVIGLATAFHRQVIAEGVETAEHGRVLLSLGCELAQGYGIARPMPASEFPKWVADWRLGHTFVGEYI